MYQPLHDVKMSGNLGIKQPRIVSRHVFTGQLWILKYNRYCKSCVICQKTVIRRRGGSPVPLGKAPLIDVPFIRIAIDMIEIIKPKSDEGQKYVQTIVYYAICYAEAILLKGCTAKEIERINRHHENQTSIYNGLVESYNGALKIMLLNFVLNI